MLGLLDIIMSISNDVDVMEMKYADKFVKYELDRGSNVTWICFLPRRTSLDIAQKYHLLPKKENIIAYEVPLNLIADDPRITRESFYSLIEDFEEMHDRQLSGKVISFLGVSVGSMPAIFLANRYAAHKVRIVCSMDKLGEGIFGAFAARKIKRRAYKNGFDAVIYDDVLSEINPINNTKNLPEDVLVVISRFDNYIPYKGGKNLVKKIKRDKKNARIWTNQIGGHFLTMLLVGQMNKKNNFFN